MTVNLSDSLSRASSTTSILNLSRSRSLSLLSGEKKSRLGRERVGGYNTDPVEKPNGIRVGVLPYGTWSELESYRVIRCESKIFGSYDPKEGK